MLRPHAHLHDFPLVYLSPAPAHPLSPCLCQELERCQHTLIGDEVLGMKGISGGQRRRVSGELPAQAPCTAFFPERMEEWCWRVHFVQN